MINNRTDAWKTDVNLLIWQVLKGLNSLRSGQKTVKIDDIHYFFIFSAGIYNWVESHISFERLWNRLSGKKKIVQKESIDWLSP